MVRKEILVIVLMVMSLLVVPNSFAEKKRKPKVSESGGYVIEQRGDTKVKYKKKNTYDFEGASIDGLFKRPSGSYISNIKDVKGRSIIRIRKNFDNEVIDSARLLK